VEQDSIPHRNHRPLDLNFGTILAWRSNILLPNPPKCFATV
jgi:hypothetical protein